MAIQAWIHTYPRVHALLQHADEPLDYVVDTASGDAEYARYREIIEETIPRTSTPPRSMHASGAWSVTIPGVRSPRSASL